jgi:hypothetical protein
MNLRVNSEIIGKWVVSHVEYPDIEFKSDGTFVGTGYDQKYPHPVTKGGEWLFSDETRGTYRYNLKEVQYTSDGVNILSSIYFVIDKNTKLGYIEKFPARKFVKE